MPRTEAEFERLLVYLRDTRGFDFTGYKRTTLVRRVTKRMKRVGITGFDDYLDYLQVHPAEFAELFNEILINVTSFFRDPDAWAYLSDQVLPGLAAGATLDSPLRCWCAGVASGEEAYTLAILLAETMGTGDFAQRVKIYATDADDEALTEARSGAQSARDLEAVPGELRDRYFEQSGSRYYFRPDLRRAIIFGRHDLVQDAAISRLDLLVCRNTLMYFMADTQKKILAQFHYALKDDGVLFLGKAEMMLTHGDLFSPIDMRQRVFRKVARTQLRERLAYLAQTVKADESADRTDPVRVFQSASDALPSAQVVVDAEGLVALINERARRWFRLDQRDVGRPLRDLELSYRPVELRSMIEKAQADRREVVVKDQERTPGESELQYLDVHVVPLFEGAQWLGAAITYDDVTAYHRLQVELERNQHELETAYEELQSTNEELETTN